MRIPFHSVYSCVHATPAPMAVEGGFFGLGARATLGAKSTSPICTAVKNALRRGNIHAQKARERNTRVTVIYSVDIAPKRGMSAHGHASAVPFGAATTPTHLAAPPTHEVTPCSVNHLQLALDLCHVVKWYCGVQSMHRALDFHQSLCSNQAWKVVVKAAHNSGSQRFAAQAQLHIHTIWGCPKPAMSLVEEEPRSDNGSAKLPFIGASHSAFKPLAVHLRITS